jgi:signal transduction histidine kinase
VVEDNAEMNRYLCDCLGPAFHCESAANGEEGYDKAIVLRPDLVITDLMMPKMSGDQLVSALRNRPDFDDTPVMLLTARADDDQRVRLLKEGAQDYVMKPFSREELLARVRNLVSMKRAKDLLRRELATHVRDLEQLAREVSARQRELELALETARVARNQAEKASNVKTNFLRLVSHELRTPLTVIALQVDRLRSELSERITPEQQKVIRRIASSTARLTDLIESVLQHTRIESGRLATEPLEFRVDEIVDEVVDELLPTAEAKGLRLSMQAAENMPPLRSDPKLVRLIVVNLVSNALKFTDRGSVTVQLGYDRERHWIKVVDTGPGIALEHQARVFEPFVHLEPLRQKHVAGVGLGLSLVREMVTALGGRIELDSELGHGARFSVALPELAA